MISLILIFVAIQVTQASIPCICLPLFPECLCPTSNPFQIYQAKVGQYGQVAQSNYGSFAQQYRYPYPASQQYNWQPKPQPEAPAADFSTNQIEQSPRLLSNDDLAFQNDFANEIKDIGLKISCSFQQSGDCCDTGMQELIDNVYSKNTTDYKPTDAELAEAIRIVLQERYGRSFETFIADEAFESQHYGENLICKLIKPGKQILTYITPKKSDQSPVSTGTQVNDQPASESDSKFSIIKQIVASKPATDEKYHGEIVVLNSKASSNFPISTNVNKQVLREHSAQANVGRYSNYQSETLGLGSANDDPSSPIVIQAFVDA